MSYAERVNLDALRTKYETLIPILTERSRRLWAATEAMSLGHGGIALVVRATGISRSTISRGIRELRSGSRWTLSAFDIQGLVANGRSIRIRRC